MGRDRGRGTETTRQEDSETDRLPGRCSLWRSPWQVHIKSYSAQMKSFCATSVSVAGNNNNETRTRTNGSHVYDTKRASSHSHTILILICLRNSVAQRAAHCVRVHSLGISKFSSPAKVAHTHTQKWMAEISLFPYMWGGGVLVLITSTLYTADAHTKRKNCILFA